MTGQLPLRNNGKNSPWVWIDQKGIRLANLIIWMWPDNFDNSTERYIFLVLYGARVEGSDLIDERVTHAALAEHCGLGSIKTVQRALAKYRKHGWLILDQEAEGRRSSYYRIPYEELMDVVDVRLNHWTAGGRNPWREGWWNR